MRYFLIDRIETLKKGAFAEGTKAIALSEDCFEQHFPGQPVYPGALLIEGMAQLGGALIEISLRDDAQDPCPRCVLSSVKAKFRELVGPGDVLTFRTEVVSQHEDSAKVRAIGTRGDERVCEADLIYVFFQIDDPVLQRSRGEFLDVLTRTTTFIEADET